jgi:hypothetical protein
MIYVFSKPKEEVCPNVQNVDHLKASRTAGILEGRGIVIKNAVSNSRAPHREGGRPVSEKSRCGSVVHTLGLSLDRIVRMFKVSTPAVSRWARLFAEKVHEKPEPREAVIIELDEIWHYLYSKNKLWIGKAYCRDTGQPIDWECGIVIKEPSHDG